MTLLLFSLEHGWPPGPLTVRAALRSGRSRRRTLALADYVSPVAGQTTGVVLRRRDGARRWREPGAGDPPVEVEVWFVGDAGRVDVDEPFAPPGGTSLAHVVDDDLHRRQALWDEGRMT